MSVLANFVENTFVQSRSAETLPVKNPAFDTVITSIPISLDEEVERAVESGVRAFEAFRNSTPSERVGYLMKIRALMERDTDLLARVLVDNHGRTYAEGVAEVRRSLENVEAAAAIAYTLAKGENMINISPGIDQELIREPLGCFAVITPFNIPLHAWSSYVPYAIALGCTVVMKPSEITPVVANEVARIVKEAGLPAGVMSVVHGDGRVAEKLVKHPDIQGVGFIGSTKTGKHLYEMTVREGKRASINAGAKNHIVVMPDADMEKSADAAASSFYGMSGQRCLAGSNLVVVEGAEKVVELVAAKSRLRLGYGMDRETEMGPMASRQGLEKVLKYIELGEKIGKPLVNGRHNKPNKPLNGYFIGPTLFTDIPPDSPPAKEEIFGPVASVLKAKNLDDAIELINKNTPYGNAAAIFTSNPKTAREFVLNVNIGNVGVNIGVPQPMAYFPLGGRKQSFFGVAHSRVDTLRFFTDHKIVTTRWW
ncbi:MAG: aldehyde dehydrogenase family protein [Candidatus Caldarchaeum sp.]|nr:aldehyde dehydrogenase family protein [Candidatus Caldarchaeum sp.]MCS7137158.1 aldehyde dehydrogenase family protein [Candidatus Caldarchaeum sp.]MDW7977409.1 aldehyde dehydrogenase family protein [Candidatus Caldarchaeum sp.]MDW8359463.1 aldehyde dehydrogenase family protein [Candidatus Caldarchaeum sp.]